MGVLLLSFIASASAKQKSVADIDGSVVRDGHYESAYFKFTYDVPSGWNVFDVEKLRAQNLDQEQRVNEKNRRQMEEASKHRGNPAYPTSIKSGVGGKMLVAGQMAIVKPDYVPPFGIWISAQEKLGAMTEPETSTQLLLMIAKKVLQAPKKVTLSGRKFYRVDIVEPDGKYHSQFATSEHSYLLVFDLYAPSEKDLDALVETMNTLHFE